MTLLNDTAHQGALQPGATLTLNGQDLLALAPQQDSPSLWWALNGTDNTLVTIDPQHAQHGDAEVEEPVLIGQLIATLVNTLQELQQARQDQHVSANLVRRIREYAIDRNRDGDICRDGLDRFLAHFHLDPADHGIQTCQVTVHARATITADDPHTASTRLRYLIDGIAWSGADTGEEVEFSLSAIDVEHDA